MENWKWRMESEEWKVENWKWKMERTHPKPSQEGMFPAGGLLEVFTDIILFNLDCIFVLN